MTPADEIREAATVAREQAERGLEEGYDPQIPAAALKAIADLLDRAALSLTRSTDPAADTTVMSCVPILEMTIAQVFLDRSAPSRPEGGQPPEVSAELRVGSKSTCRYCDEEIVWEPWFRDGRGPNPPVWSHTRSGTRSCSTVPASWTSDSWPFAEPRQPQDAAS